MPSETNPTATRILSTACGVVLSVVSVGSAAEAAELEGYTEPYRTINVGSDETGTLENVLIQEGQKVQAGDPLVELNSDVHYALLAIAEHNMQSGGRLDAAVAEQELQTMRLKKLQSLLLEGHARQEEVDRTLSALQVATANVRTAQEEQITRRLEYEKIKAQIARRTIRSPISGLITTLHKDKGEFVAPNNPDVLTIVQVDTLLARLTVPSQEASQIRINQPAQVVFLGSGQETTGVVEFISHVTDAESGTVLVKVRIENPDEQFRSGDRCRITIEN